MSSNGQQIDSVPPERKSLCTTLLRNSSSRLYVHPLEWTAEHLKHLSYQLHVLCPYSEDTKGVEMVDDPR